MCEYLSKTHAGIVHEEPHHGVKLQSDQDEPCFSCGDARGTRPAGQTRRPVWREQQSSRRQCQLTASPGALRPGRRDSRPPSLPLKRPAAAKPQQDNRSSSQKSEGSESHAAPRRGKAPRERLCLAGRSPGGRQALRNEGPGARSTRPVPREGSAADWPRAGLEAQHLWAPENLRGRGSGQAAGELHLKPPTRHCRSGFVLLSS